MLKVKKRIFLILIFLLALASLLIGSVAYYRIVINGSIGGNTGNVVFNVTGFKDDSSETKAIELGQINPGDEGEFTITMDASGSEFDMYLSLAIDRTDLPSNLKFYTTSDHKSELHKYYSLLEKSGSNKETLTIYWYWNPYIDDLEDTKYINKSFNASINVSAVQISEYAMMKNGNGVTSDSRLYFWKDTYRPYIRTITFGNDLSNLPSSCTGDSDLCWDVSDTGSKKKVYAYLIDSGLKMNNQFTLYNLYIVSEAPIFAPSDCSLFFAGFNNLISINYNNNFNTSKVTNMSYMFLPATPGDWGNSVTLTANNQNVKPSFIDRKNDGEIEMMASDGGGSSVGFYSVIEKLDLSNFNTSNVTNMSSMFYGCSSLTSLNLSNFNTSSVTDMSDMFSRCSSLTSLDLSSFNASNVTNMDSMFSGCSSLISLDLSSFNTTNVTSLDSMFYYCSSLISLDVSGFNTSKVTNMSGMFRDCSSLTNLDLSSFNASNVTNMDMMFSNCSSLTNLDLSSFNTSKVTNMSYMFSSCSKLQTQINIMNANTTSYRYMFQSALTDPDAYVIIGYTTETQSIATAMKSKAGSNSSKITLKQI